MGKNIRVGPAVVAKAPIAKTTETREKTQVTREENNKTVKTQRSEEAKTTGETTKEAGETARAETVRTTTEISILTTGQLVEEAGAKGWTAMTKGRVPDQTERRTGGTKVEEVLQQTGGNPRRATETWVCASHSEKLSAR